MGSFIDLTGQKFGRLTVITRVENKGKETRWLCRCECGNETVTYPSVLKNSKVRSCGCYKRENLSERKKTHGECKTRLYKIWQNMRERTTNINLPCYNNYGGRGIEVCDSWKNSYEAFRDWAMDNGYSNNLSIDRINVDGNYEPENCRWATRKEQANNRRVNFMVTYMGRTQTLKRWCEELGLKYKIIWNRIVVLGWSTDDALSTTTCDDKKIEYKGKVQSLTQWCNDFNLKYDTIWKRINHLGWTIDRAFEQNERI